MKHPVSLTVVTTLRSASHDETTELHFNGDIARRGDKLLLTYADHDHETDTHLLLSPDRASIHRSGNVRSHMVLAPGLRHTFDHSMGRMGSLRLTVACRALCLETGRLTAEYDLYVGDEFVASHRLSVGWTMTGTSP